MTRDQWIETARALLDHAAFYATGDNPDGQAAEEHAKEFAAHAELAFDDVPWSHAELFKLHHLPSGRTISIFAYERGEFLVRSRGGWTWLPLDQCAPLPAITVLDLTDEQWAQLQQERAALATANEALIAARKAAGQ